MFRRIGFVVLTMLMIFIYAFPTSAMELEKELRVPLECGYTESGIYYEVYEVETGAEIGFQSKATGGIAIIREVIYYDTVTPPLTINHSTTISGMVYYGVLYLDKYTHMNDKIYAYYRGTIYPAISQ